MTEVTETELATKAVAPRVTEEQLLANIEKADYIQHGLLTICVLTLRNGFTVLGESACASPENFDEDLGRRIANSSAQKKIWPLMGYALREKLYQENKPTNFLDRLNIEIEELNIKINKLDAYLKTNEFDGLDEMQKLWLNDQFNHMCSYAHALDQRLKLITG